MKPDRLDFGAKLLAFAAWLLLAAQVSAQTDPLPSWNDGPAKKAIVDFVQTTTSPGSPNFVPPSERIATFDQDGTLWVEHPIYTQVMYVLESVPALVKAKPELASVSAEPLRGGEEERLDRDQHEGRLEADFLVRVAGGRVRGRVACRRRR